jgi:hypothetical protein
MSGLSAVDLLANQLMSYFGDTDDAEAIARIREDVRSHPETSRAFGEGLERALADPACDRVRLVRGCANRRAASDAEARAWLERLMKALASP